MITLDRAAIAKCGAIATPRRAYPRSLPDAFSDARAGCWSGPYRQSITQRLSGILLAVVLGVCGAVVLFYGLSK